ncbi:MAG: nucleotidyl transferase AbiEii/AbiGii toxin family protein [Clostridia bacterium]|nr:nucleotidyl transferase AbiEii/AbiGii toxin family protein [Clostridia bacterium]
MYLHEDLELFRDIISATSEDQGDKDFAIIEKDYYVTMILKLLAEKSENCVFKGGTSLSKCHKVIDRFSEDIDISFSNALTQGQRRRLKDEIIAGISTELKMPIVNWDQARSRRDYNCYIFDYQSIDGYVKESLIPGVKMEVVLSSLSFPTVEMEVTSLIYDFLKKDNAELIEEYNLQPFKIKVQGLDRTFIDKTFAICDYYLQGKTERHSRHIYDLYMLSSIIKLDDNLAELVREVREQRVNVPNCLSVQPGVSVNEILKKIEEQKYFFNDYISITSVFQNKPLPYEEAITVLQKIIETGLFK